MFLLQLIYSQLLLKLPYPENDLSGQTIIVTGANVGLGFEAARHFVRLGAEQVILAVRSLRKGEAAKQSIEESTGRKNVAQVWLLDLNSYDSVQAFGARVATLPRLDAIVENASIAATKWELVEGNESSITVNVISTFLLALLVLPKLRETAVQHGVVPRLAVVVSEMHQFGQIPKETRGNMFDVFNDQATADMPGRYPLTKLLQVLAARELAKKTETFTPPVTITMVNPGLCHSELTRNAGGFMYLLITTLKALLARSTETGSRTLVHSGSIGREGHGKYLSDSTISDAALASWIPTKNGAEVQERVWNELAQKLEAISPGILKRAGI